MNEHEYEHHNEKTHHEEMEVFQTYADEKALEKSYAEPDVILLEDIAINGVLSSSEFI